MRLLHRRHRHRPGHRLGPFVDRRSQRHLPDGDGPVLPGSARGRRDDLRRAPGPGAGRQRCGDRAADGRDRGPVPTRRPVQPARAGERRLRRRRAPRRGLRALAAAAPRPAADHRRCERVVIARGDKAQELCERPVWITGFAHYAEIHYPGLPRPRPRPSRSALAARPPASRTAPVEVAELQTAFTHEEPLVASALGLGDDVAINPSGGPLAGEPDHGHRPGPHHRSRRADPRRGHAAHAGPLDVGSVPAAEPRLHLEGRHAD